MGRKFWLFWLAYIAASWLLLNLLTAPEYIRLWGSDFMPSVVTSMLLPFSGLKVADYRVYFLVQDLWPCLSMLAWKTLAKDWSFKSGLKGTIFAIVLAQLAGNVVLAASPGSQSLASFLSGTFYWTARTFSIALVFNAITVFLSRLIAKQAQKDAVEPALRP